MASVRVKVFKDEEVDGTFFEAQPVKCFRRASGVKYGGRFLIIRRDMGALVAQAGVATGWKGKKWGRSEKKIAAEKAIGAGK